MPDLDVMRRESNDILDRLDLPLIDRFEEVEDSETASPTIIGVSDSRHYVIKSVVCHPDTLRDQVEAANWVRAHRDLPVPEHYGFATEKDRLPLVIMEWLPGTQLRLALQDDREDIRIAICRDWGRCTARVHTTEGLPDRLIDQEASKENWGLKDEHYQMTLNRARAMETVNGWPTSACEAMRQFIVDRKEAYRASTHRGLTKRDIYERDFLVVTEPETRVSGVLDWERVNIGYTPANSIDNYLRLHQRDSGHLWISYCEGYETEFGRPFIQDEAAEFFFATRFLIAANNKVHNASDRLLDLLGGRPIPFGDRE